MSGTCVINTPTHTQRGNHEDTICITERHLPTIGSSQADTSRIGTAQGGHGIAAIQVRAVEASRRGATITLQTGTGRKGRTLGALRVCRRCQIRQEHHGHRRCRRSKYRSRPTRHCCQGSKGINQQSLCFRKIVNGLSRKPHQALILCVRAPFAYCLLDGVVPFSTGPLSRALVPIAPRLVFSRQPIRLFM